MMADQAVGDLATVLGTRAACKALGHARASYYRRHRKSPPPPRRARERKAQPRALSPAERAAVLDVLHEERFVDQAPASIYADLLDEGRYLCSVPTMYRVLRAEDEVRKRRRQATHPAHVKPELVAYGPNQTWSWDITKLLGPQKWTYFYLYVVIDIFSRYIPGWLLATRARKRRTGGALPGRDHPQAPHRRRPAHDSLRSWHVDGVQDGGTPAG